MHLIVGADKFQNLDYLVEDVCRMRQQDKRRRIYVIVPENRNMLVEKALLAKQTGGQLFFTEVLSVKRLAYRLFSETLAFKKEAVSKELASLLIYKHVKKVQAENAEQQTSYSALSNYFYKPEYMQKLLNTEKDIRRFQLNLPNLLKELDKLHTAKASKLKQKLQALQDLSTAYQTSLETAKLTDNVGIVTDLVNLLTTYQQAMQDVETASALKRLQFLANSSFYFYGYAEDNFITQQEWSLLQKLAELDVDLHLSLRLPNLKAAYEGRTELISCLDLHRQEELSYFTHQNIRELASDIWLSFFNTLPKQASQLYQAGIAAFLTALRTSNLGPLALTYLLPKYDGNQLGVEAKLCQLVEQSINEPEPNSPFTQNLQKASLKPTISVQQRALNLYINSDKIELFRSLLNKVQADCCGEQARFNFADCAILFAKYEEDSSDFLAVANEFGLPLYLAEEQKQSPILSSYLHSLWQILRYGLNRETVFAFLRSALWQEKLRSVDLDAYENYIISHDLNYNNLLGPFRKQTDFSMADLQREATNCLDEVQAGFVSQQILWPLANLQKQLRHTAKRSERLLALLNYFVESNLALRVEQLSLALSKKTTALHRQATMTLQTAFSKFIKHYHELLEYSQDIQTESLTEFLSSLELGFAAIENKNWPSQGGQILVGAADKALYMRFKQIYLINCEKITNLNKAGNEGIFSQVDLDLLAGFQAENKASWAILPAKSAEIRQASLALNVDLTEQRKLLNLFYDMLVLPTCELNIWQVGANFSPLQRQLLTLPNTSILKLDKSRSLQKAIDYLELNAELAKNLQMIFKQICSKQAENVANLQVELTDSSSDLWRQLRLNYLAAYALSARTSQAYPKRNYRLALLHLLAWAQDCLHTLQNTNIRLAKDKDLQAAKQSLLNKWQLRDEFLLSQRELEPCSMDFSLLKRLLAGQYSFSINQLEAYRQNPFAYFCRYLLGLKEASTQAKDLRNYGILLHAFAELTVRAFYLAAYKLSLVNASESPSLNNQLVSSNINLLSQIVQPNDLTMRLDLPRISQEQQKSVVPFYSNLIAPFVKDYELAISFLSVLQNSSKTDFSLLEKENLNEVLKSLQKEQSAKLKFVTDVFQIIEQREHLDFRNLVYEQVVYPQLIRQASYSLKHILAAYNTELLNLPSKLEQRFELSMFDDSLDHALALQADKMLVAKQIKLLGKIDRIDTLYSVDCVADSQALIDYKSGDKSFDYERLLAGIDLQMPLYTALVSKNLPVSEAIYLRLKNLYTNNSSELVQKQVRSIAPNYFLSAKDFSNLWSQLKLPTENKAVEQFALDKKDEKHNRQLLASLANYSFHLSQASLVNILNGEFAYKPLLSQDGLGNLPYAALAKYDVSKQAYNYLASESYDVSGQAKSKFLKEQLKNALELFQSDVAKEKLEHE